MAMAGAGGRELATRVAVGAGLAGVGLAALWEGIWSFTALVIVVAILALREWMALDAFSLRWRWFLGVIYVGIPSAALIWLRTLPIGGIGLVDLIIFVCLLDIGAFAFGRLIGGPKLWPTVSPSKTWAGLAGALICAGVYATYEGFTALQWVPFAVLAILGDLFESALKRRAGVKDSGNLLPGHGGVLDRIDSLIPVAPAVAGAVALGWL